MLKLLTGVMTCSSDAMRACLTSAHGQVIDLLWLCRIVSHYFDRCPRAFRAEVAYLTSFNVLQLALSEWVTPYTTAFVGRGDTSSGSSGSSGTTPAHTTPSPAPTELQEQVAVAQTSSLGDSSGSGSGSSGSSTGASGSSSAAKQSASEEGLEPRYEDEEDGGAVAALMAKPLAFQSAEHQSSVALAQLLGVALQPMLRPLCVPVSSLGEVHRKLQALLATFKCVLGFSVPSLGFCEMEVVLN